MRRIYLMLSFIMVMLLTGCQSAEVKELIDYHNDYVENVAVKIDDVSEDSAEIWQMDPDKDIEEMIADSLEVRLNDMKTYMETCAPERDMTITYHDKRLEAFNYFYESVQLDFTTFKGIIHERLDETDVEKNFEESARLFDQAIKYQGEADDMLWSLAEEHEFKVE